MANPAKRLFVSFAKWIAPFVYDRRYLTGKHFLPGQQGWRWVAKGIWFQKILGFNRNVPWPIHPNFLVSDPKNLHFHPDDLHNFQSFGCYFQNFSASIRIGKGSYIAPNVGLITANHDPESPSKHLPGKSIELGENCWIGMNAVILPGVILGPHTIVGAGAVVSKSFPEGYCTLVGVPARKLHDKEFK
ncbi:MAG: acyltransferase [Trueperaceae bacterium]|nr:acyltransferase [Trueperaceae bacterium]